MISKLKYTALSLLIIFAYSAAHAVINGVNVTVTASTLCNNGTIEKNFVGGCPGAWNEGALSAPVSSLGYQPAGTAKTCTALNNLVCDFASKMEAAYQGIFELPRSNVNPHPELPSVNYAGATYWESDVDGTSGAVSFGSNANVLYVAGATGGINGGGGFSGSNAGEADSISAFQIPTLLNTADVNDRTGIQVATQTQPWTSVFKPANGLILENVDSDAHTINGMHYDHVTGMLCLTLQKDYDNPPYSRANMLCYEDPTNLSSSNVKGYYSVGRSSVPDSEIMHASGWMADIPTQWRTALGGRTLWGGGGTAAILARLPAGPTLFAGSLDALGNSGSVVVNQHMTFFDEMGKHLGGYLYAPVRPDVGPWYNFEMMNCTPYGANPYDCGQDLTDSNQVVPWVNNWWTIDSYGMQGFIIPNTDTYVVIGTMEGGEEGLSYKGDPDWGEACGGPCRAGEHDYHNKYWLFDINDILSASNPWEVFPYEHGYIPFLDQFQTRTGGRSLIANAGFDLNTGRLAVVLKERTGQYSPTADVAIFQSNDWQEAE